MANGFDEVRPGDIISSALWNNVMKVASEIQAKLIGIDEFLPGPGRVAVPNLFGLALGIATTELMKPKYSLLPGEIYNTGGQRIFPENTAALELAVLNQVPEAGRVVPVGSKVGLVIAQIPVAAAPTGGSTTPPAPSHQVTGMKPSSGANAGQSVEVLGSGFVAPFDRNKVIFDGAHIATPELGSGPNNLVVTVPLTVPNLPRPVQVAVQVDAVTKVLPSLYPVSPKSETPELKINSFNPPPFVRLGQPLQINGTGFSSTAQQNNVTFISKTTPTLKQTIAATTVEQLAGGEMRLGLTMPTVFAQPGMAPASTGTEYIVEINIGADASKVAKSSYQVRPPA